MALPVYLALDVSASMPVEALERSIVELVDYLLDNPVLSDKLRLSVVAFSDEAEVLVPLSRVDSIALPRFQRRAGTQYAPVLTLLRSQIESDVAALRASGEAIYRPLVYFLTDGTPTDSWWEKSLSSLSDQAFRARPRIIAVGIGDVDPQVLERLAGDSGHAFLVPSAEGGPSALLSALDGIRQSLASSIVGSAAAEPAQAVTLPAKWIDLSTGGIVTRRE